MKLIKNFKRKICKVCVHLHNLDSAGYSGYCCFEHTPKDKNTGECAAFIIK